MVLWGPIESEVPLKSSSGTCGADCAVFRGKLGDRGDGAARDVNGGELVPLSWRRYLMNKQKRKVMIIRRSTATPPRTKALMMSVLDSEPLDPRGKWSEEATGMAVG